MGKPELVFDIVNSVKGGSGKSTIALNLAIHHSVKNTVAYIIDLDLRGTSWVPNYSSFFEGKEHIDKWQYLHAKNPHQSLLYNEPNWSMLFRTFMVNIGANDNRRIHVCVADPEANGEIDDPRADFLCYAVIKIIELICAENTDKECIHIIFDMPPSYERHAERVIEKVLLDTNSILYQQGKADISINMYMVCALTPAHFTQNFVYLESFLNKGNYSSLLLEFIREGKFKISILGNDVTGITSIDSSTSDTLMRSINENCAKQIAKISKPFNIKSFINYSGMPIPHTPFKGDLGEWITLSNDSKELPSFYDGFKRAVFDSRFR